jgi:hypothetical protein
MDEAPIDSSLMEQESECPIEAYAIQYLTCESWLITDSLIPDPIGPKQAEIEMIECLLIAAITDENARVADQDKVSQLGDFGRQYCASTSSNGDRYIYLNAYKNSARIGEVPVTWEVYEDGGPSRFEALFDMTKMQIVYLL